MKTIKLKEQIEINNMEPIQSLDFGKLKAKHLMDLSSEPSMRDMIQIAGKLCGQSQTVMGELEMEDLQVVLDYVGKQFSAFQAIGND